MWVLTRRFCAGDGVQFLHSWRKSCMWVVSSAWWIRCTTPTCVVFCTGVRGCSRTQMLRCTAPIHQTRRQAQVDWVMRAMCSVNQHQHTRWSIDQDACHVLLRVRQIGTTGSSTLLQVAVCCQPGLPHTRPQPALAGVGCFA